MRKRGFTDKLACYIVFLLTIGMFLSFYLSIKSIEANYIGSLACWTVVFTPIGTALSLVLASVVNKNKAENTSADGDGIKYRTIINEKEGPTI